MIDFRLDRDGKNVDPPLSWKLTQRQRDDLDAAWRNWMRDKSLLAPFDRTSAPAPPPPTFANEMMEQANVEAIKSKFLGEAAYDEVE